MAGKGIDDLPWPRLRHRVDLAEPPPGKRRFEDLAAARREERLQRRQTQKAISGGILRGKRNVAKAKSLVRRLDGSGKHRTLASHVCKRDLRIRLVGALSALLEAETDGSARTFTVLPGGWPTEAPGFLRVDNRAELRVVRSALNRELKALRRSNAKKGKANNPNPGWLICFIDGEWDAYNRVYTPHLHGIASGEWVEVVKRLKRRKKFKSVRSVAGDVWARVHVAKAAPTYPLHALSYLWKAYWLEKSSYINAEGKVRRSKHGRRLRYPHNTHVLFWFDQWRLQDLTLMMGLRVTRKGLVRTVLSNSTYTND